MAPGTIAPRTRRLSSLPGHRWAGAVVPGRWMVVPRSMWVQRLVRAGCFPGAWRGWCRVFDAAPVLDDAFCSIAAKPGEDRESIGDVTQALGEDDGVFECRHAPAACGSSVPCTKNMRRCTATCRKASALAYSGELYHA